MRPLLLLLLALVALPARAGWVVAESANFRLFAMESPKVAAARVAELEDFRALLVQMTGLAPPGGQPRLDIYLVPDLAAAAPGQRVAPGVAGFYRATGGGITAFVTTAAGPEAGRAVLFHEIAHHFMFADTRVAYPAWYVEGFAEYVMTARLTPTRVAFGHPDAVRLRWLDGGTWLSPEELLRGGFDPADPPRTAMFYAQSWLLAHWLFRSREGPAKLRAYLGRTALGEDPVAAFRAEIMADLDQLNSALRAYRRDRRAFAYFRASRRPPAPVRVAVRQLPPAADRLLLVRVALAETVPTAIGEALLARARAEAERAPADPFATATLGLAELHHGDPLRAVALFDRLLAAGPEDAELLRWRAAAALAAGEGQEAARLFLDRAIMVDPSDWQALMALAAALPAGSPERLQATARAWTLAPQVPANILAHALALAEADRMAEAAAVLQPLAWSPHGGPMARTARRLGAHAARGDRAAFLAAFAVTGPVPHPVPKTAPDQAR